MTNLSESQTIREVLEVAEYDITLPGGFAAVAVETYSGNDPSTFEGTLLYVPGIRFIELERAS